MIQTKVQKITPEQASDMLGRNHLNTRSLNTKRVQQFAAVMKAGKWHVTHQGIALDNAGNILDGQHRLYAIVEAKVPVELMVTTGLDQSMFTVIDVGRVRTVADILTIGGHQNASLLGAALRLAYTYESTTSRPWGTFRQTITPDDINDIADTDGERMKHVLPVAQRIRHRIGGSSAAYAAALFIADKWAEKHGQEKLFDEWLTGLDTGVGLGEKDSRLALSNWMNGGANYLSNTVRTDATLIATLRAFGAAITGTTLEKMAYRDPNTWYYRLPEPPRNRD